MIVNGTRDITHNRDDDKDDDNVGYHYHRSHSKMGGAKQRQAVDAVDLTTIDIHAMA